MGYKFIRVKANLEKKYLREKSNFMENFRLFKTDIFLDSFFSQQTVQMNLAVGNYQCHSWKKWTCEEINIKQLNN